MTALFRTVEACVFDAYGTLFDVHSSVARHRERIGERAQQVSVAWRQKQLEYTWLRSLMARHVDFHEVTADALDYTFEVFGIQDDRLKADLLAAYRQLDCYAEVKGTLQALKERGLTTAILSNGSPSMLGPAVEGGGIAHLLDEILSVEAVGIYKPAPAVYQLAVDRLGVGAAKILFMSSNAWDIAGAAAFGCRTVWVNRFGQTAERLPAQAEFEVKTLEELTGLLDTRMAR